MTDSALSGRFDFRRVLGRGGTADVSLVWDARLNRLAALKQPRDTSEPAIRQFCTLIQREQLLIGQERFPGLVRILDARDDDQPFLVLEYCDGSTLDACRRDLPLVRALNILSAVALSLHFIHARQVIHGDLKPQNVFLPRDLTAAEDGRLFWAKLFDLSFGRRLDEPESSRLGLGTVGYMAPEQLAGQSSSVRSDLFALGVMGYQLLSGRHPYLSRETDPVKVNAAIREENPPNLHQIDSNIPAEVAELIAALMHRDPSRRPTSAWEVCAGLEELGTRYPYRRALQPGHFVPLSAHFHHATQSVPGLSDPEQQGLIDLAMNDTPSLRLLLAANHARGFLAYDGTGFRLSGRPYWPCRLRRRTLARFTAAGFGRRRQLAKAAVVGTVESAVRLGILPDRQRQTPIAPLLQLLRHCLKSSTIRRFSCRLARQAEDAEQADLAALLYLQCGDLHRAEQATHLAATRLQNAQQPQTALHILRRLRHVAELSEGYFAIRQCLLLEGIIHHEAGRLDAAEAAYNRVVACYDGHDEDVILGKAYKCLGDVCKARQQFDDGVTILGRARELYQRLGQELELSHTLNNLGNIYWVAADYRKALDHYRQALHMQKQLKATFEVASTLSNIGSIYVVSGRYQRAERIFNLSLRLKKEIGHLGEMARTLNNLGYTYYLWGRQHRAVEALTESLRINRRIGSQKEILFNLENLATLMIVAGQMKEALSRLREGLELARHLGDIPHEGVFNGLMATVLRRTGRFDAALRCLDGVADVLTRIDDSRLQIVEWNNRAWCHYQLGDHATARSLNDRAMDLALAINDKGEQLQALMLRVRMSTEEQTRTQAIALADELGLRREKLLMHLCLIDQWLRREQPSTEGIQPVVDECRSQMEHMLEDLEFAWMNIVLAEYDIRQGDTAAASGHVQQALAAANRRGLMPEAMTALLLTGRLQRAQGAWEQAFESYRKALDLAKQMASSIANEQLRDCFMSKRTIRFLAEEIRSLSTKLSKKERAGA
jgi:tetratricopeptide (TPR) repeat protein